VFVYVMLLLQCMCHRIRNAGTSPGLPILNINLLFLNNGVPHVLQQDHSGVSPLMVPKVKKDKKQKQKKTLRVI
jgi:hypothetical protein